MFSQIFKNKIQKALSMIKIVSGKLTKKDQKRIRHENAPIKAKRSVDLEITEKYRQDHPINPKDRVIQESGSQDVSAI
jgi:hypothetical protein